MKTKNIHSKVYSQMFHEGRLLFQTGNPDALQAQAEAKLGPDRATSFINLMSSTRGLLHTVDIPVTGDVGKFLDANPFRSQLYEYMKTIPFDDRSLKLTDAENKPADGALDIKYEVGGKPAQTYIDKLAYVALMWEKVLPVLKLNLDGKLGKVSVIDFCHKMVEVKKQSFENLVLAIAKDPAGFASENLVDMALDDFDIVRRGVGEKARDSVKVGTDAKLSREELADKIREERDKLRTDMAGQLVFWEMAIVGENQKIDPQRWDITTNSGINLIREHWNMMGILKHKPKAFFENGSTGIFDVFKKANADIASKSVAEQAIYKNPLANFERLDELSGEDGRAFAEAVRYFKDIKDIAEKQDTYRVKQADLLQTKDREPITAALGNALKSNGRVFMESLRSGDYTTAGAYVLGLWAIYKAYDGLDKTKRGQWSTWMFRGAAVYAAHIFAKNAGYDMLKKLGITDLDAELKDTSLDSMYDYIPGMKNVDSDIVSRMSNTNIGDLYKQYEKTNGSSTMKARRWIDPAQFRKEFGDRKYSYFAGMTPNMAFKPGRSTDKEREYRRVGQQLYLLVEALKQAYDGAMRQHETKEFASFEYLVKKHPVFQNSTVHAFTVALRAYVIDIGADKELLGLKEGKQLQERLDEVLNPAKIGYNSDLFKGTDGVFFGNVMDFPMVFLRAKDGIKIIPKHLYKESTGGAVGVHAIATIPYEGDYSSPAVKRAVDNLKRQMTVSMVSRYKIFRDSDTRGVKLDPPHWDDNAGKWRSTLIFSGRDKLIVGSEERKVVVYLTPGGDGKGLTVVSKDNDIVVHIKNVLEPEKIRESLILAALVRQETTVSGGTNFGALKWFLLTDKLQFKDVKQGDMSFEIRVGTSKWINIELKGGVYVMDPADEKYLLESHSFQRELAESVGARYFDDTIKRWDQAIENTPKDYLWNFFTSIPGWFTEATSGDILRGFKAKSLTGSVAKNYTKGLVRAQKQAILSKFTYGIGKANSLGEVDGNISDILIPGRTALNGALREFSRINSEHEKEGKEFSADEFEERVLNRLIGAVHKSYDYKVWYKEFMNEVYSKYGMDDFRTRRSIIANDILAIYAHYTAPIDLLDMDGADLNYNAKFTPAESTNLQEMVKLKRKLKVLPTLAQMQTKIPTMTQADYDNAKANLPEFEKMANYLRAKAYVAHVKEGIWARIGSRTDGASIDSPGTHWDIKAFENFEPDVVHVELADTTKPLRMRSTYVTLDVYLDMSQTDRAQVKRENIILPRVPCKLVFKSRPGFGAGDQFKLYKELITAHGDALKANKRPPMTEFEAAFVSKIQEVRDKIFRKYNGTDQENPKVKAYFMTFLNEQMNFDFDYPLSPTATKMNGAKIVESEVEFSPKGITDSATGTKHVSRIFELMHDTESSLGGGYYKTVTREDQDVRINAAVRSFFQENILKNAAMAELFFDEPTVGKTLGRWWDNIKIFLFGY